MPEDDRPDTPSASAADWWARNASGDMTEADRQLFAIWLENPANARAYRQMEAVFAMTRRGEVAAELEAERRALSSRKTSIILALAASLTAATVGAGVWKGWLGQQARQAAPTQDHASAVGEIRTLRLTDGSILRLDTDSRVRISYTNAERRITLLAGRARFEVAHDAKRPFIVRADGQAIIAVGTVFDVRLDGNHVSVALIEGKVRIEEGRSDEAANRSVMLKAGQRLVADGGVSPTIAPMVGADRWPERILTVHDATLRSVVDEVNRYNQEKIIIGDPELAERRITVTLKLESADVIALKLAAALGLKVTHEPGGDVVITPAGAFPTPPKNKFIG